MNKDIQELLKTYDDLEEQYKLLMKQNKKLDNELKHKTKQYEFVKEMYNDLLKVHEIENNDIQELQDKINKSIEYIEENCIDDEFYINLTKKEKSII